MTADRSQIELRPWDLDSLIPRTHRARALWAFVERLDLDGLYDPIKARGDAAGRPATDPKILLAPWLFAISQGVGSAREIERLCQARSTRSARPRATCSSFARSFSPSTNRSRSARSVTLVTDRFVGLS